MSTYEYEVFLSYNGMNEVAVAEGAGRLGGPQESFEAVDWNFAIGESCPGRCRLPTGQPTSA